MVFFLYMSYCEVIEIILDQSRIYFEFVIFLIFVRFLKVIKSVQEKIFLIGKVLWNLVYLRILSVQKYIMDIYIELRNILD